MGFILSQAFPLCKAAFCLSTPSENVKQSHTAIVNDNIAALSMVVYPKLDLQIAGPSLAVFPEAWSREFQDEHLQSERRESTNCRAIPYLSNKLAIGQVMPNQNGDHIAVEDEVEHGRAVRDALPEVRTEEVDVDEVLQGCSSRASRCLLAFVSSCWRHRIRSGNHSAPRTHHPANSHPGSLLEWTNHSPSYTDNPARGPVLYRSLTQQSKAILRDKGDKKRSCRKDGCWNLVRRRLVRKLHA